MKTSVNLFYIVSFILKNGADKGAVRSKKVFDLAEAVSLYEKSKSMGFSSRLAVSINDVEITMEAHEWGIHAYNAMKEQEWERKVRSALVNGTKLNSKQVETVLAMENKDLRNAVACADIEKFCELKGIGEKSAKRIIRALKALCKPQAVKLGKSREFTRIQLVNDVTKEELLAYDTIRKTVSPLESKAMDLGGKDAVIHIVSKIDEPNERDEATIIRFERLVSKWLDIIQNGIMYNNILYRVFGHGTNAAKWCKTIAVKDSIYESLRAYTQADCNPNWMNTAAKDIAYKDGLISVYSHRIDIPFSPEMFAIYPTVVTDCIANTTKLHLDGHAENKDNNNVPVARSDGFFGISISPKMKAVLFNRMVASGADAYEAEKVLNDLINDCSFKTYRGTADDNGNAPLKLKGLGCKTIDIQSYLRSIGTETTPDGRDIDDVVFFVDETVIKTAIGKDKAYETFDAWCKAMGESLYIGFVVRQHCKELKSVSYQVTQSMCEATPEMVEKMAQKTVDILNGHHSLEGASKLLGREWGKIAESIPELVNVALFKEQIEKRMTDEVNEAFSGKMLKGCYYAFACPDPFFILAKWHGKDDPGMLMAGQVNVHGIRHGKLGGWRSPVVHPNSERIVENVAIPEKYRKFIKSNEFVVYVNCYDDLALALDMDFDGDHMNVTDDEAIITAIEETLKKWNRLIIWETPKPTKRIIDENALREYFAGLTHMNELGLTVYQLNALLNGLLKVKDEETGRWYIKRVPMTHRGIDFKKFAANVLVDASKHGGANIEEPEESAQGQHMIQPWAKDYQDAVKSKKFWYVSVKGDKYFFETETAAKEFYTSMRYHTYQDESGNFIKVDRFESDSSLKATLKEPINYLNEMADPNNLPQTFRYKTLNMLFAYYAEHARRDTMIDNKPSGAFDHHKIMFEAVDGPRGMTGLIRKGKMHIVTINGESFRPDQGLFDHLARRFDRDRSVWQNDSGIKDKEGTTFEMNWRAMALAEIEAFANSYGKTLEDAYDAITWYMFTQCDKTYLQMDGKLDFLRNKLWQVYKVVFGGMAVEAVHKNLGVDDDAE